MNPTNAAVFVSSLLLVCAACLQVHAAEEPANPNVARQATVTARSEDVVRRRYFARCAADGLIPVEDRGLRGSRPGAGRDTELHQFPWRSPGASEVLIFPRKAATARAMPPAGSI
jgi:hypothetical protein